MGARGSKLPALEEKSKLKRREQLHNFFLSVSKQSNNTTTNTTATPRAPPAAAPITPWSSDASSNCRCPSPDPHAELPPLRGIGGGIAITSENLAALQQQAGYSKGSFVLLWMDTIDAASPSLSML